MLLCRNKDLPGHMSTFLRSMGLVLHMDPCGSTFDKHFREFHDGGEAAVAGIRVSDNWTKEVYEGGLCTILGRHVSSRRTLLAIVEKLCHKEMFHLSRLAGHGERDRLPYWERCPLGSRQGRDRVHLRSKRLMNIASRRRRRSRDIWPSERRGSGPTLRRCALVFHPARCQSDASPYAERYLGMLLEQCKQLFGLLVTCILNFHEPSF